MSDERVKLLAHELAMARRGGNIYMGDCNPKPSEIVRAREILDALNAEPYSGYPDRDDHVDAILAAVREALLSDDAVEAALDGERRWSCGGQDMTRMHPTNRARRMVESALDAAFGERGRR